MFGSPSALSAYEGLKSDSERVECLLGTPAVRAAEKASRFDSFFFFKLWEIVVS